MTNFFYHTHFFIGYKYVIHNYYDNTYETIGYYHFSKKCDLMNFLEKNIDMYGLIDVYVVDKGNLIEYKPKRYQNKSLEKKIDKLVCKNYEKYRKNIYSNDLVDQLEFVISSEHLYTDRVQFYKNIRIIHDQLYFNYIK